MTAHEWQSLPLDAPSREAIARHGLEYRLVDTADAAAFGDWLQASTRGFLDPDPSPEELAIGRDAFAYRRTTGVYDPSTPMPTWPVATVNSWIAELTMPGGRGIPMWAISEVTVAPTHRRRGIARALLQGELRTAADAGVPIAGLTVSEATIYGRFGFAPAAFASDWVIETARARWTGPRPEGRVDFIDRERATAELFSLHERVRRTHPGEINAWPGHWRRLAGTAGEQERARKLRAIRYADAGGRTRGIALYRLAESGADFTKHELTLSYLLTETADAYAALWCFLLELDLVSTVRAPLRSVDEPLRWMIADQRAASVTYTEHQWLRVLDVPRVLQARRYGAAGACVLHVDDPLGFAEGTWMLRVDADGRVSVDAREVVGAETGAEEHADAEAHAETEHAGAEERADAERGAGDGGEATAEASGRAADVAGPEVRLSAESLSAMLLGGVRASTLWAAGRVHGEPEAIAMLDRLFAPIETPWLGLWY